MKHLVVVNPKSFGKESDMFSVISNLKTYFEKNELNKDEYQIYISRYPRDAIRVVNKYLSNTSEVVRVYSVGGDGILYDCLNGLIHFPNAQLAIIPYGTTNDFVRAFGEGNQAIFRDIEKQANAPTIPTDVICIGNRYVLNFCGIGIEAATVLKYYEVSRKYPLLAKKLGKHLYMAVIPFAVIDILEKGVASQKYEVIIDGEHYDGAYLGINFANGSCYAGDKTPFPMAHPADGLMEVMMLSGKITPNTAIFVNRYTKGKYYKYPKILRHIRAKEIIVRSNAPMHINADGEAYYGSEINAKIIPAAVNIVAPSGLSYVRRQNNAE